MNPFRRRLVAGAAAAAASATAARGASAQASAFPTRPIRLIVPYGPGSATDVQTRTLLPKMSEVLGQQVVVENRPGATGTIGAEQVARTAPDGYTIMVGTNATHATMQSLTKLPYVVMRDFSFIGRMSSTPAFVIVNNDVPARTLPEFVAWAKTQPQGVPYGSTGNGGSGHLASELIRMRTGINLIHVPYKEGNRAVTDLIGGEIKMMSYFASILPQVKAGRLRALAVTGTRRAATLPEVPTMAEAGFPAVEVTSWWGLFAPTGVGRDQVAGLSGAVERAMQSASMKQRLDALNIDGGYAGPDALKALLAAETVRWGQVIRAAGISAD